MIGRLRGTLIQRQPPVMLVECGGVGYEVEAPLPTFLDLPATGSEVVLAIHQGVRDDVPVLYGFLQESERALFRALLKVTGIGARTALGILSGASPAEFAALIEAGEVAPLTRIPGIGRKTAERLLLEMRDRVAGFGGGPASPGVAPAPGDATGEAVVALQALGYKPPEALRMARAAAAAGDDAEAIIRKALKSVLHKVP